METKFLVKRFVEYRCRARGRRAPARAGPRLSHALITSRRYRVRMCTRDIGINFNERSVRGQHLPACESLAYWKVLDKNCMQSILVLNLLFYSSTDLRYRLLDAILAKNTKNIKYV